MKRQASFLIFMGALACAQGTPSPAPSQGGPPATAGPSVPAKVLIVRESSHPPTRAFLHKILVAGPKVRLGSEKDQWRLFDVQQRTVTWVDDIAGTYRTIGLDELVRSRERQLREPIPAAGVRPVAVEETGEAVEIAGIRARRIAMELGGYRRDVWISEEPLVSPVFLKMLVASEPISEQWAGVIRDAQLELMAREGFPIWDRSRLAWEGGELLFQRKLVKVEMREVPAQWVAIPAGYRDVNAQ
jgi:hypothetical protein